MGAFALQKKETWHGARIVQSQENEDIKRTKSMIMDDKYEINGMICVTLD